MTTGNGTVSFSKYVFSAAEVCTVMVHVRRAHYFGGDVHIATTSLAWSNIISLQLVQLVHPVFSLSTSADVRSGTNFSDLWLLTVEAKTLQVISVLRLHIRFSVNTRVRPVTKWRSDALTNTTGVQSDRTSGAISPRQHAAFRERGATFCFLETLGSL